jgi:hypothetical protein
MNAAYGKFFGTTGQPIRPVQLAAMANRNAFAGIMVIAVKSNKITGTLPRQK